MLETMFGDSLGMEYHDYYVYHNGGNGHPRVCLKSADAAAFWVNHLSHLEHRVKDPGSEVLEAQIQRQSRQCSGSGTIPVVAVIPYWGGPPEKVGNAHSQVSRSMKLRQAEAVACSLRRAFGTVRVIFGVANSRDEEVRAFGEVWRITVKHGAHLAFGLLRRLQHHLETDIDADYVYFTEADQILWSELDILDLTSAVGQHVYVAPNRLKERFPLRTSGGLFSKDVSYEFSQNICNGELVATARRNATKVAVTSGDRGGRVTWLASTTPRASILDVELLKAKEAVDERSTRMSEPRFAYASASASLDRRTQISKTTFVRCWDSHEKQVGAWFAHVKTFLAANFDTLRSPLKSLSTLTVALDELKRSASWHSWALSTGVSSDFATCKQCRGRWPPYDDAVDVTKIPHRRRRRHHGARKLLDDVCAPYWWRDPPRAESLRSTSALALMPLDAYVDDETALRSLCSVRQTFPAVVVGVCDIRGDHQRMASRLAEQLPLNWTRLADCGRSSVPPPGHRDAMAALPLAKFAWTALSEKIWRANYVYFGPVGDHLALRSLDDLKTAVSPTTFVVAHRYHDTHDGLDTLRARPFDCDNATRDWLVPLNRPDRTDISKDTSAYLLVPR